MKLHPEDPRLTAYVLGELPAEEVEAVETAAKADPTIQAEIDEIRAQHSFISAKLDLPEEKLQPAQRENIRRLSKQSASTGEIPAFVRIRESIQPYIIPASIAAVLAVTTFILIRMPGDEKKPLTATKTADVGKAPARTDAPSPGPAHPVPPAPTPDQPPIVHRGSLKAAEFPSIELPVHAGNSSLGWVKDSIIKDGKLPTSDKVRLEEMVNAFALRFNGVTSIARDTAEGWHPDSRPEGVPPHLATLSTETIPCPWKPSSILLFVSLRANATKDCEVKLSYNANPDQVFRYRLLGFVPEKGATIQALPTKLAANSVTTLVIEIEPSKPGGELGSLSWDVSGKPAPAITISHKQATEPSDDARFAALICTFAQWLAGDQIGIIDGEIVSGLAREIASSSLAPEREEFLNLIDRSLHL